MEKTIAYLLAFYSIIVLIGSIILRERNFTENILTLGDLLQTLLMVWAAILVIGAIWYVSRLNNIENQAIRLLKKYSNRGFYEVQIIDESIQGKSYFLLKSDDFHKKVSKSRFGRINELE
ncbi:hypothetical protein [Planococcus rifietoensis]|uniref:hypothetical protein n=1 Tax=Planococcus rifietoensis TaxID=200991 RepID=UPI00384E4868